MENKDGDKKPEEIVDDLLDQALEGFEDENKLNLTNNDTEKDEEEDPELEKEYQAFLKSLNQEGGPTEDDAMGQFSNLMSNLLSGMKLDEGTGEPGNGDPNADAQLKGLLEGLMKGAGDDNFDSMAQNFLREFMDKDILQEPLLEAKKNYETYLDANKEKLNETDKTNYNEQYNCINKLLEVIEKEPENKEQMINIFEKMHDYGMPPEGILNPLSKVPFPGNQNFAGAPSGFPQGGAPNMPPNMSPEDMAKQMENCNIF
jgi:peroxin-19